MRAKIVVYGATKEQRKIVHSVSQFMISELFSRYQVSIDFHLKKLDGVYGYCNYKYDNYRPRDFQIEIEKSLSNDLLIETIIHELIHVEQMVKDKLKYRYSLGLDSQGIAIKQLWYGKDFSKASYDKQPWEKDAYKREKVFMKKLAKTKSI